MKTKSWAIVAGLFAVKLAAVAVVLFVAGCTYNVKPPESDAIPNLSGKVSELEAVTDYLRAELKEMRAGDECICKQCKCKGGGCPCSTKKCSDHPFAAERLHALLDLSSAFSKITAVYFHYAKPGVDECQDEEVGEEMAKALAQAREVVNRSAILFDLDFNKDVDWYFEIFRQLNHLCVTQWASYRVWMADLTNHFDDVCKERLARAGGDEPKDVRMPFEPIPFEHRIKLAPDVYLHKQMDHWNESKKQTALPSLDDTKQVFDFMQLHEGRLWVGWTTSEGEKREWRMSRGETKAFLYPYTDATIVRCRCCAGCECEDDTCNCTPAARCSTHCNCKRSAVNDVAHEGQGK